MKLKSHFGVMFEKWSLLIDNRVLVGQGNPEKHGI